MVRQMTADLASHRVLTADEYLLESIWRVRCGGTPRCCSAGERRGRGGSRCVCARYQGEEMNEVAGEDLVEHIEAWRVLAAVGLYSATSVCDLVRSTAGQRQLCSVVD